ncbi:MAG: hypothetical protein RQM95_08070 [Syntrophaceticus schinkii]
MFARRLREELEKLIGPEYAELVVSLGQVRRLIREQVDDPARRRKFLEEILPPGSLADFDEEKMEVLRKQVKACISSLLE